LVEGSDAVRADAAADICKDVGPFAAHALRVGFHHTEIGTDERREIDLVDDKEIGPGNARAALARDLLAAGDVDDVDRDVGKFRRERRGEVAAPGLDKDQIEIREPAVHFRDGGKVYRGVLTDRRVGTAAGLDTHDALDGQRAGDGEQARV